MILRFISDTYLNFMHSKLRFKTRDANSSNGKKIDDDAEKINVIV